MIVTVNFIPIYMKEVQCYNLYIRKACFTIGFSFLLFSSVCCQSQASLDSLELIYSKGGLNTQDKLKILKQIAENTNNPDKLLAYSDVLIQTAKAVDSVRYIFVGYLQRGHALRYKSDLDNALKAYFIAAKITTKKVAIGVTYIAIADVYSIMNNHPNAVEYYQKAIAIFKEDKDSINMANAMHNLGDRYINNGNMDSALKYTKAAQAIFYRDNNAVGEAYCLGNLGKIYAELGNVPQAELNLDKAIGLLQDLNEYPAICVFRNAISDICLKKGDIKVAESYALKSLELAKQYGLIEQVSEASMKLSEIYEKAGKPLQSLTYYKESIQYRDSVSNLETVQKMADLRTDFEVSQKQKEVDLLTTRNKLRIAERNGFIFASLLLAAILAISIYFYTQRSKRNKLLAAQKMQEAEIVHQKDLLESVITSQEAERKRIGMDLHDEVGAALSTLRIKIEQQAGEATTAPAVTENYKSDIDKIIANMRHISHALSPRIAGNFGFYDAVHELADGVNRSGTIHMQIDFDENNLPVFANEQAPMALYRVIAELVNNTLKHAKAQNIQLSVAVTDDTMDMAYSDDGIGIAANPGTAARGMGMQNIESRLGIIGATWAVQEPEGGGYGVAITVPLQ
jgi:signal transduction histidine kinase